MSLPTTGLLARSTPAAYAALALLTSRMKGLMIQSLIILQNFEEFEDVG
jgi:hypothetical protein